MPSQYYDGNKDPEHPRRGPGRPRKAPLNPTTPFDEIEPRDPEPATLDITVDLIGFLSVESIKFGRDKMLQFTVRVPPEFTDDALNIRHLMMAPVQIHIQPWKRAAIDLRLINDAL